MDLIKANGHLLVVPNLESALAGFEAALFQRRAVLALQFICPDFDADMRFEGVEAGEHALMAVVGLAPVDALLRLGDGCLCGAPDFLEVRTGFCRRGRDVLVDIPCGIVRHGCTVRSATTLSAENEVKKAAFEKTSSE
jgi:hypothetical protein